MDTTVRMAKERDAEAACHVLRKSITDCCVDDHGGDPNLIGAWLANKTPANVRTWIGSSESYALVAESRGVVVGFASLLDSGEIPLCYVMPEVRFKGVGKALLFSLEASARGRGMKRLHLESTKTARSFYTRNGFESSNEVHYAHGMAGYPMAKTLEARTPANVA